MDDSKYGRWKIGGEKAWVELQAENGVFVTGLGNDQVGNLSPEWRRSFLLVNGASVNVKKVERAAGACKLDFGFDGGTGVLEYEAFLRYLNPGGLVAVWDGSPEQFRFSLFNGIWLGCVPPDLCAAPDAHLRAIHRIFLDRIDFFTGELEPAPCDAVDGAVHIFSNGSKDQYVLAHAELYGAAGIRTCRPKNLKRGQRVRLTDIEREFSRETVYDPQEGLQLPPTASVSFYVRQ